MSILNLKDEGFSLLEVLASISIIAIVFVAVFRMQAQTITASKASRFYVVAPLLAQKLMADVETKPNADIPEFSGDFGADFPGYLWEVSIEKVESELLGNIAQDLKKIDVKITCDDERESYDLRSYKLIY